MTTTIGRRDFISALGGTAFSWPLAARAQKSGMPVIGFLNSRSLSGSENLVAAFRRGLAETGYIEGQTVKVEFRWGLGQYGRLPQLAAELVSIPVNIIAATGGEPAALAAKAATSTIPIVFSIGNDPVRAGLVASYSRPGGNLTGVNILTRSLEAKRIGLLRELMPRGTTLGFLMNPNVAVAATQLAATQEAVRGVGLKLEVMRAANDQEIEMAFEKMPQQNIATLAVGADAYFDTRRDKLVALAARYRIPTMFQFREYAVSGGLMSYGIDLPEVYRHVGDYSGRILKGAKPSDLPVLEPTKFEFVINLKTAKTLGVKISDNLLSLADEVIE